MRIPVPPRARPAVVDWVGGHLDPLFSGELRASGGNYALSTVTVECLANDVGGLQVSDNDPVPAGGFWYLMRSTDGIGPGTYDNGSSAQVARRDDQIQASGNACP